VGHPDLNKPASRGWPRANPRLRDYASLPIKRTEDLRNTVNMAPVGSETSDGSGETASPLAGLRFQRRASDLARFLDDPLDEAIARVVVNAASLSYPSRDFLRSTIDAGDSDTLFLFARRRAASALRRGSLAEAQESVLALTLITLAKVDFRDLSVDFPLYSARKLGGDIGLIIGNAVALSEPGTSRYFAAKSERAFGLSLQNCALLEIRSSYGLGFMDVWSPLVTSTADLAKSAVLLADEIDSEGQYAVQGLHVTELPEVWFTPSKRAETIPTAGCVSLSASLRGGSAPPSHGLLVFLAELHDDRTASKLEKRAASATDAIRPQVTAVHDRRIVLVIGGSSTHGEDPIETPKSLSRFRRIALAVLQAGAV